MHARDENRGPAELVPRERDRALDLHAERLRRPAEVVADDRADHREHARDLQGREDVRAATPGSARAGRSSAAAPRRSASARSTPGCTDVSPRSVFTSTGKKQRTAAITIFDHGLSMPNQAFVIGANAIDRNRVRRDQVRHQRVPERAPAGEDERRDDRDAAAEDEPAERLLEGDPAPPSPARRDSSQSALSTSESRGRRKRLTPRTSGKSHCQATRPTPKTTTAGSHVRARSRARARRRRPDSAAAMRAHSRAPRSSVSHRRAAAPAPR